MKSKYTIGSRIHKALNALRICPQESVYVRKTIDFQGSLPQMMDTVIMPAVNDGMIFKNGSLLSLTTKGAEKLKELGAIRKPMKTVPKVSKMEGTYSGVELRKQSARPGAYDFLDCPSLLGDRRYDREGRETR